jgi:hypothetical protein
MDVLNVQSNKRQIVGNEVEYLCEASSRDKAIFISILSNRLARTLITHEQEEEHSLLNLCQESEGIRVMYRPDQTHQYITSIVHLKTRIMHHHRSKT